MKYALMSIVFPLIGASNSKYVHKLLLINAESQTSRYCITIVMRGIFIVILNFCASLRDTDTN